MILGERQVARRMSRVQGKQMVRDLVPIRKGGITGNLYKNCIGISQVRCMEEI